MIRWTILAWVALAIVGGGFAAAQEAPLEESPATGTGTETTDAGATTLEQEQASLEGGGAATTADVGPSQVDDEAEAPPQEPLNHETQVGIRAGFAMPYVFAVKYGEGPICSDVIEDGDPQTFCRRFGSPLIDLELSFGVSPTVELGVLVRLGLSDDEAADTKPLAFGFGARAYTSPDAMFKGFFGFRAMLDVTKSDVPDWSSVDIGMRGELGLQLDVIRYLGIYVQMGESLMFLRGLYFVTDFGGGIQGRFP